MEGGDYFDIDDILASQQTVLCRCEVNVPKLGFLDTANTNVDIRVGTKMDLPCWLAKGLSNKNRTVVSVEIARPYRASYRNVLEADAQIVNLSKFCLYYYDFGIHMLSFAGTEQREILQTLLQLMLTSGGGRTDFCCYVSKTAPLTRHQQLLLSKCGQSLGKMRSSALVPFLHREGSASVSQRGAWMSILVMRSRLFLPKNSILSFRRYFTTGYIQGQSPEHKVREYFYYMDHSGQLFLDDARMKNFTSCFKEIKFLQFFFNRLRKNKTDRYYPEFPYISLCGRERNFLRCEDTPIVYYKIFSVNEIELLAYCNAEDKLTVVFDPSRIYMNPSNGRVYYPAEERFDGVGLVAWPLAIELSKHMTFEKHGQPTKIYWRGCDHILNNECAVALKALNKI